ncbi:AMP-binding enzyme [Necator americanus]|uniref:acetate--CoA ligase n=1 Tax=Necator americanus TaxID=51031 RepID=W2T350_NECAM|nr:AMP-binding enzyme [Necator americanus]ETN76313.1 AMP-binding enzyme [Necator americanus]
MDGAKTNISYNCLERNIKRGYGNKVAYIWEGNEPSDGFKITYSELHSQVVNFSAVLRGHGVRKGDVVALYLPMITELAVAMLACARIGAMHSVVFAGFSASSLGARIIDANCCVLVTADGFFRGKKYINLKGIASEAVRIASEGGVNMKSVIIVSHQKRVTVPEGCDSPKEIAMGPNDFNYTVEMAKYKDVDSPVEWMDAESPLFLLYTSGSTGKPKGIQHSTAGYMVYAYFTTKCSFDAHPDEDVYWCTADCGWITGHTHSRASLELLGTVGEPINPAAWKWLYNVVGNEKCAIVDTFWQTETVAEAAVVAAPHDIKGSFPYAFVTLNNGEKMSPSLALELKNMVRKKIGAIAVPEVIQSAPGLPKTRSGKVTRRILRKIAEGCESGMGDTTTLVDEEVIKHLIAGRVHG